MKTKIVNKWHIILHLIIQRNKIQNSYFCNTYTLYLNSKYHTTFDYSAVSAIEDRRETLDSKQNESVKRQNRFVEREILKLKQL